MRSLRRAKLALALAIYAAVKNRHFNDIAWNTKLACHYWLPNGEPVSGALIADNLAAYEERVRYECRALGAMLGNEEISLATWEKEMKDHLADLHRAEYMAGRGGREWMTQSDWGSVGGNLGREYDYLNTFSNQIAAGQCTPAQIAHRSGQYAKGGYHDWKLGESAAMREAGYAQEKRVPTMDGRTCADCAKYDGMDWAPYGSTPRPGHGCACGANCRCRMEYQNSKLERDLAADEIQRETIEKGGITYDCVNLSKVEGGFAVGAYPDRTITIPKDELDARKVYQYAGRNKDLLINSPSDNRPYLGTWFDKDNTQRIYFDCSVVVQSKARAAQIAAQCGEKEFIDLNPCKLGKDPIYHKTADAVADLQRQWHKSMAKKKELTPWRTEGLPVPEDIKEEVALRRKTLWKNRKRLPNPPPKGRHLILTNLQGQTADEAFKTCLELVRKLKGDPDYDEELPDHLRKEWER